MKFTILSHAGLLIETPDCSLVSDPWLVGSCYWRSWWNYPPPPADIVAKLRPDFIYLTHLHWDHFHGPSLRRFDKTTTVLVPEAHFGRMIEDLQYLGFTDIRELPHGVEYELGRSTSVRSYQFGLTLDSAIVVRSEDTTLLNANDCKIQGLTLKKVIADHPKINFVLRSHSNASAYPYCVTSDNPDDLSYRTRSDYARDFLAFAECVGADYAIPFASNHCFLHRETDRFNDTIVSPYEVRSHFENHHAGAATCVVMPPGSSWSESGGFHIEGEDYLLHRDRGLREIAAQHAETLARHYEVEDSVCPDWEGFERYFRGFLDALPLAFRLALPGRIVFRVFGGGTASWLIDLRRRMISRSGEARPGLADVSIDVHSNVLKDCCDRRMFSVFSASKRVHYTLKGPRSFRLYFVFTVALDLYESDYFPLRKCLHRRFLRVWRRRWRELLTYGGMLPSVGVRRGLNRLNGRSRRDLAIQPSDVLVRRRDQRYRADTDRSEPESSDQHSEPLRQSTMGS